jgi:biotin operon repressor
MSAAPVRNRLAEAFANLNLGSSRKQLDALKTGKRPSPLPNRGTSENKAKTVVKKTMVEKTIVKPTIVKKAIVKPAPEKSTPTKKKEAIGTVAKKTIVKSTTVKPTHPAAPAPAKQTVTKAEKSAATIVNKTIVERTIVKPATVKITPSPVPAPPPAPVETKAEKPENTMAEKTIVKSAIVEKGHTKPSGFWGTSELWELVDDVFPTLSPNEITLFLVLLRESYGRDSKETGFISMNELSKRTGLYRKSIPPAMETLEKKGLARPIENSPKQGSRYSVFGLSLKSTDSEKGKQP